VQAQAIGSVIFIVPLKSRNFLLRPFFFIIIIGRTSKIYISLYAPIPPEGGIRIAGEFSSPPTGDLGGDEWGKL
jgi:hypothetical protein